MGYKEVVNEAVESEATYKIITYPGAELPDQYRNLVLSKFLRSLRYGNEYFKLIDKNAYFTVYDAYFKTLLYRPNSVVRLAVLTDDPDVVLGWSLMEDSHFPEKPDKLHYVYVNNTHRKLGIGSELVKSGFQVVTHLTTIGSSIWASKFNSDPTKEVPDKTLVVFNPFA